LPGRVLQVSVSLGGMPKHPVLHAEAGRLGLSGDVQRNTKHHGGPRQALLWITSEGLEELKAAGYPVYPGAMGENITSQGVDRRTVRIGQRWQMGEVEVEVTKVREPCYQLEPYGESILKAVYDAQVLSGDTASPRWGLSGFYLSVAKPGLIAHGDPVRLLTDVA
jgi:MOSC domain-containing protein YiiM